MNLTNVYMRAKDKEIPTDEKTNTFELRIQLGCIHYVVTFGKEGSNASKQLYDIYELYDNATEK